MTDLHDSPDSDQSATDARIHEKDARQYVRRLGKFYRLCLVAAFVVTLTGVINFATAPHRLWFLWVVFGFAVALIATALNTFGRRLWLSRAWEERKVREYLGHTER